MQKSFKSKNAAIFDTGTATAPPGEQHKHNSTISSQDTSHSTHGTGAMDWYLRSQLGLSPHHRPLIVNGVFRYWKYRRSRRHRSYLPPRHSQNTDCLKWKSRLAPTPRTIVASFVPRNINLFLMQYKINQLTNHKLLIIWKYWTERCFNMSQGKLQQFPLNFCINKNTNINYITIISI